MDDRLQELLAEHQRLCHAMQSGVAYEQEHGSQDGTPKHLRVGVNTALRDMCSLVELLVAKGIFTDLEYAEAIVNGMRQEVAAYEARISAATGKNVHLR